MLTQAASQWMARLILFALLVLSPTNGLLSLPATRLSSSAAARYHPLRRAGVAFAAPTESELRRQLKDKNEDLSEMSAEQLRAFTPSDDVYSRLQSTRPFFQLFIDNLVAEVDDALFQRDKERRLADGTLELPEKRKRVLVLGAGWGAHAFISGLDTDKYEATVISPRNFFLFTPMLAGASVGTCEFRSITQPIRGANPGVDYLEATCTAVNFEEQTIDCEMVSCEGNSCDIEDLKLQYDHLVVSVGATSNTFGVPGVREHCNFLKQVEDAAQLRRAIGNCFERANSPNLSEEEIRNALTFVVIGAGPTGVEFCGELCDFVEQDVPRYYPHLLDYVQIKLIEASDRVLMAFDEALQKNALETLSQRRRSSDPEAEPMVQVLLKAGVKQVEASEITLADNTTIPYGLSVWAAGNGPLPLVMDMIKTCPQQDEMQQAARGRLVTDPWMKLKGAANVWAIGDCAFIDGENLPPTAQVAAQQGTFLSRLFSRNYDLSGPVPSRCGSPQGLGQLMAPQQEQGYAKAFQFLNLGILAYLGDSKALAQIQVDQQRIKSTGVAGFALWRSVYLSKQVSWRNRVLVALDWVKTRSFGRDITRV